MFRCECVYRRVTGMGRRVRYRNKGILKISSQYKKLDKIITKALKEGKQINFKHKIVWPNNYDWYDKVTVTIK